MLFKYNVFWNMVYKVYFIYRFWFNEDYSWSVLVYFLIGEGVVWYKVDKKKEMRKFGDNW